MLVTTKQPSSNPRLVKEAIALANSGYAVSVVYNYWSAWADEADINILKTYSLITWIKAGSNPSLNSLAYWYTRIRHKCYRTIGGIFKKNVTLQALSLSQFYPELKAKACSIAADLYIAHNLGALPVAVAAAKKNNSNYSFDAEDFHRSQEAGNTKETAITRLIEDAYFADAVFITAASPLIAAEYKKNYPSLQFTVINNVFSKQQQPSFVSISNAPLKLFWFSQTVGLKRGVQDIIAAMNLITDFEIELTILGDTSEQVKQVFNTVFTNKKHQLIFLPACNEQALINTAAWHHIGLALEPGFSLNNNIALSNKLFTYLLAGNAAILSGTPAQQLFYNEYPGTGWCYSTGDIKALADILEQAYNNENLLQSKRQAAWQLANTKLNWENEQEVFLNLVKKAV
ncbi:MAG: hypothetical protein V4685_06005 [Bacteroidota bacterium]